MKRALFLLLTVFFITAMLGCEQPADERPAKDRGKDKCTELVEYPEILIPNPNTHPTGPYQVVIEGDPDLPNHTIFRPVGAEDMPILAWGEGGCVKMGRSYGEMMTEVASYGILVIADGAPEGGGKAPGTMMNPVGDALVQGIDYAFEKNKDRCSPLYKKVDTSKVAVSGQSCGGLLAIDAAADPRVTVTFIMSSGLFTNKDRKEKLSKIHTPVIYLNGGPTDVAYAQATKDIDYLNKMDKLPVYWANRGIGHMADILEDNGGTFGAYLTDWMRYQFFEERSQMFEGDNCGYCQDKDHTSERWTLDKFNGAP